LQLVAERCKAYESGPITYHDITESFQSVDAFWADLFPVERHRLVRLLVEKVEIRETGIDMILKTGGINSLVTELAGLACQVNERRPRQ
jgi:site-specific DNA recombinase